MCNFLVCTAHTSKFSTLTTIHLEFSFNSLKYFQCCQKNKLEQCLSVLVLLGRLLNDIPGLAEVLVHQYNGLLRELGNGLLYPEEAVVSALVYIMIFVFREDLQPQLPIKLCHQVHHCVIIHLARTETQELQINLLGLLQRNLLNETFRTALLELSLEGSTLLTCLKKLLMSSNDVLQMSAVQSCSLILVKGSHKQHGKLVLEADIAEILFEQLNRNDEKQVESVFKCLAMLADIEDFFTRCHSVYGIGSVLRAINCMSTQKNPAPLREGLQLLTIILERQPTSIPLFSSQADVKSCLVTLATELEKSAGQVAQLSLQVFKAFLRISHLGSPVPFGEIGKTLELAGKRTAEIIRHGHGCTELRRGSSRLTAADRVKDDSVPAINTLLLCLSQAVKVVEECVSQPSAREETYCPPHLTPPSTALSSFVLHILRCCDEFCIPSVMVKWETMSRSDDILVYFSLLHHLHCVCPEKMLPLKYKLVSAGFFSSTFDVKTYFRSSERHQGIFDEVLVDFLTSLSLDMTKAPVATKLLSNSVRDGLKHLQCKLSDVSSHLLDGSSTISVHYVCLKIAFLCLLNDDICLSAEDIQSSIVSSLYHFPEMSEWPPLTAKYLTFLAAWCYNAREFDLSQHCKPGFQSCLQWLSCNPLSSWYTDHPLQFAWVYSNPELSEVMGPAVLEQWLTNLPSSPSQHSDKAADRQTTITISPTPDSKSNQALLIFSKMMNNTLFRNSVKMLLLKCSSQETLEKLAHLITAVIYGVGRESTDIQHWASNCLPQSLQSIFLNKEHVNDSCVIALLHILLSIKDTIQTKDCKDMKIIFHLINLVTKALPISSQVREMCLQYISSSLLGNTDQPEKTVSSMLLQRGDFLKEIEVCLEGPENSALTDISLQITANLVLACSKTVVPAQGIKVNLRKVIRRLQTDRSASRLEAIRLLAAYLSRSCQSKLLILHPSTATDLPHDQPLTFRQLRVIWIYCQQSILQDCGGLRDVAVSCMLYTVRYLLEVDKAKALKILSQPWNKLLVNSLMNEFDGIHVDQRTVQLLSLFLQHPPGQEIVSEHHLNRLHDHLKTDSAKSKNFQHLKSLITKVIAKK
ncbi:meiosis inhibitor protein 1-like isoform X2 [Liolophura sinensis]|uniref:meiosis inhibitor protein 1-like isoform X2 n=1 Tax=Liolophura sinensis TaxID=3198878 RepID=UPI0031596780